MKTGQFFKMIFGAFTTRVTVITIFKFNFYWDIFQVFNSQNLFSAHPNYVTISANKKTLAFFFKACFSVEIVGVRVFSCFVNLKTLIFFKMKTGQFFKMIFGAFTTRVTVITIFKFNFYWDIFQVFNSQNLSSAHLNYVAISANEKTLAFFFPKLAFRLKLMAFASFRVL